MNLVNLVLASLLAIPSIAMVMEKPHLVYRTANLSAVAVGYDTEADSPVELVKLGSYGPSVVRRVQPGGRSNDVILSVDREAFCALSCGMDLQFSKATNSYFAKIYLSAYSINWAPSVYSVPRDGGTPRLIARAVLGKPPAQYPERVDRLEPGVLGFRSIETIEVTEAGLVVNGLLRDYSGPPRSYLIDVVERRPVAQLEGRIVGEGKSGLLATEGAKGWVRSQAGTETADLDLPRTPIVWAADDDVVKMVEVGERRMELRRDGRIYRRVNGTSAVGRLAGSSAASAALDFSECGTDTPTATGLWVTKRGTFMIALDCAFNKEQNGKLVYGGLAHCLYEVQ